jgi:hypothetical protein
MGRSCYLQYIIEDKMVNICKQRESMSTLEYQARPSLNRSDPGPQSTQSGNGHIPAYILS